MCLSHLPAKQCQPAAELHFCCSYLFQVGMFMLCTLLTASFSQEAAPVAPALFLISIIPLHKTFTLIILISFNYWQQITAVFVRCLPPSSSQISPVPNTILPRAHSSEELLIHMLPCTFMYFQGPFHWISVKEISDASSSTQMKDVICYKLISNAGYVFHAVSASLSHGCYA